MRFTIEVKDDKVPYMMELLSNHKFVKVEILSGLNHNLQTAITGGQNEYNQIAETIAPQVLEKISTFIEKLP